MRVLSPTLSDELLDGPPEKRTHRRVDPNRDSIKVGDDGTDRGLLEADLEADLRGSTHLVGLDPLRVVHHRAPDPEHSPIDVALRNTAGAHPALYRIHADHAKREV